MSVQVIVEKIKDDMQLLQNIFAYFDMEEKRVSKVIDTSYSVDDIRVNFLIKDHWVIKINSKNNLTEPIFKEINQVISNYNKSGIYVPNYQASKDNNYLYEFHVENLSFVAYVEEYAPYPIYERENISEALKKEILEATARYMNMYTGIDLMSRNSMWSIIERPLTHTGMDEKEENLAILADTFSLVQEYEIVQNLYQVNQQYRENIKRMLPNLRKCSIQGDLNASNILIERDHFIGLIDFNLSGTEVNINNILNETRFNLSEKHFEKYSPPEIFIQMTEYREKHLLNISKYYSLDSFEKEVWDDYRKVTDLFLWPNVILWKKMIEKQKYIKEIIELLSLMIDS